MRFLLPAIAAIALAACSDSDSSTTSAPRPVATVVDDGCSSGEIVDGTEALQPFTDLYSDAFERAASTSRIALSGPVGDMQEARRGIRSAELPQCMERYRGLITQAYDAGIDAFLAFQSDEPESAVTAKVTEATRLLGLATNELARIR